MNWMCVCVCSGRWQDLGWVPEEEICVQAPLHFPSWPWHWLWPHGSRQPSQLQQVHWETDCESRFLAACIDAIMCVTPLCLPAPNFVRNESKAVCASHWLYKMVSWWMMCVLRLCAVWCLETFLCICKQILAAQTLQLVLLFIEKFCYALIFSLKTKRVELV